MSGALLLAASSSAFLDLSATGTYTDNDITPGVAQTNYILSAAGAEDITKTNDPNVPLGDWITPPELAPGDYEVRCTATGDALLAGSASTGVWLALTSSRTWSIRRTAFGISTANLTIEIRKASGIVLDSVSFSISAIMDI